MEEHFRCSDRSMARVSSWYLFIGIYCWDRCDDTVACHQRRWRRYVWSISTDERGSERDKTAESCQPLEGEEDSHRSGDWPQGCIRGQKAISNDGWWRLQEKRRHVLEKDRVEPDGRGFVRISGEYVRGCLHSWTLPLPCLHKKLRHLASTRRTSLGFWRQEVDCLILCKLQSWLWGAVRENQPLWFAVKIKFENWVYWDKHVICD